MPSDHSVTSHAQRKTIDRMILAGVSLRKIQAAVSPKVSVMALQRYKTAVIVPAIKASTAQISALDNGKTMSPNGMAKLENAAIQHSVQCNAVAAAIAESPVRERLESVWKRLNRNLETIEDRATSSEDIARTAPLIAQAHKSIEILGQLTGELTAASHTGPVTIVQLIAIPQLQGQAPPPAPQDAGRVIDCQAQPAPALEPPPER